MKTYKMEVGGRPLIVEIGKLAGLAQGACTVYYGDTVVLVTACASKTPREGLDFLPLSCEYVEKSYAVGKIPGGFIKREGKPSEKAVLTSRLIDRPIRPLFPENYHNDVQVIATVLSVDQDCTPDVVAMIGSSIALSISNIPFAGPTGSVSVGLVDGEYIINPTLEQREASSLDLIVAGTKESIVMTEAGANELTEKEILEAILFGHLEIKKIVEFIEGIVAEVGQEKVIVEEPENLYEDLELEIKEFVVDKIVNALDIHGKQAQADEIDKVTNESIEYFEEKYQDNEVISKIVNKVISNVKRELIRSRIMEMGIRPDGRKPNEIRPIWSEVGMLPRTHGSGLFTRGETQVMTIATLGSPRDAQRIDGLEEEEDKSFIHQYNFPPYSVGETGFMRGPGRREIGHGALAERSLLPMMPDKEDFPYSVRLVSEVLSSNGSSSQASVCGSTLALMDAGVPIKSMVAGIAMGLIEEGNKITILSDIQGVEDALGDMDFKVAGTEKGITAMQMDIKIKGINRSILEEALEQARIGRLHILDKMKETIDKPRPEFSKYAPKIVTMSVHPDKIRDVIGTGGKVINKIIEDTGVEIDIEDDGTIYIVANNQESGNRAIEIIEDITRDAVVGEVYKGKVIKIMNFGAFVEILPGKEGLLHISNIAHERINKVEDVLAEGDEVEVKLVEIDNQGKMKLSRKAILPRTKKF
ncbi:MAG TPA: polyribonucleotide nucleotidyltransferase [Eubacteriaceae bacterium]|jgi:polyribonucleotide nucleotidyltransferase|nr:polyribonucleotide nucleotidyltransferase [Eubacteriaceae bacterium]